MSDSFCSDGFARCPPSTYLLRVKRFLAAHWLVLVVLVTIVALVVVGGAGMLLDAIAGFSRWLEEHVRRSGSWGVVAFVGLALLSSLVSPFSSVPVVPAAVLAWGHWPTFLLLVTGWMLGDTLAWTLGRYAAHPLVRRLLPWKKLERLKARLPRQRTLLVAGLLRIALPSEIGYAYGALRFPLWQYLLITLIAEVPVAAFVVLAGHVVMQSRTPAVLALLAASIALAVAWWLMRGMLRDAPRQQHT